MQEYSIADHRIGVCTVVRNTNNQFLVVPRKENPEKVCSPGGGMEFWERTGHQVASYDYNQNVTSPPKTVSIFKDVTPACTARRELFEETGILGESFILLGVIYENGKDGVEYATHMFLLEEEIPLDFQLVAEDGVMPFWLSEEDFIDRSAFQKSARAALRWTKRVLRSEPVVIRNIRTSVSWSWPDEPVCDEMEPLSLAQEDETRAGRSWWQRLWS